MRNQQDTDGPTPGHQQATDRPGVDVSTAARHFGITPDAVRGRLQRGSLPGERLRGQWVVFLETATANGGPPTRQRQDTGGLLIAALQAQVEDLQRRLDRADVHLQAVIGKLPNPENVPIALEALMTSPEARSATETISMTPDTLTEPSRLSAWLRRLFGR